MSRAVLTQLCTLHKLRPELPGKSGMRKAIQDAGIGRFSPCDLSHGGDLPELGIVIAGDGFNVGKKRKFLQVLIHFLNDGRDALNVRQRFNIALADCSESRRAYEQMRVWATIAQTQGKAWRNPLTGAVFRIKYYLSGDWMFMKAILGISNPNQDYFCLWCTCNKSRIADPGEKWAITRTGEMAAKQPLPQRPNLESRTVMPTYDERYGGIATKLLMANYEARPSRTQEKVTKSNIATLLKAWDKKAWAPGRRHQLWAALRALYAAEKKGATPPHQGQERPSLVPDIPFADCVIDVLHTFLRITDVMLASLIEDACRFGRACLNRLQEAIRKCGLPRWEYRVGGVDVPTHRVTWDSLDGADKLKIVDNIDILSIFTGCVPSKARFDLGSRAALWRNWSTIYLHLREWQISIRPDVFVQLCHGFLVDFLGLRHVARTDDTNELFARSSNQGNLYYDRDVTPYLHALAYHVPQLFMRHGQRLMQFSCFAGEKQNHIRASQFFKRTNHGGGKGSKPPVAQLFSIQLRNTFNPLVRVKPLYQCAVGSCPRGYEHRGNLDRHHRLVHSKAPMPRQQL